jgi:hypothetical protein
MKVSRFAPLVAARFVGASSSSLSLFLALALSLSSSLVASCGGSVASTNANPDAASPAPPPPNPAADAAPPTSDASPPATVDRLYFAVVGDTRPPTPEDTAGYPTAVISQIFAKVAGLHATPLFVVGTGDYQYSDTGSTASTQLDLYLAARAKFAGPFYPTMGNHECNGYTDSNCGPGGADGMTGNYNAFVSKMLAPIKQTTPYYAVSVTGTGGAWTAKILFVAANAWSAAQATWLDGAMAQPTTYTFIVRHEPSYDSKAPGVDPSEQIMAKHPYTLAVVGHTHTFRRESLREVIIGNGGAPLSGGVDYGFGLFTQRADGAIQVEMIDYQSGQSSQAFAVKADGSAAP